MKQTSQQTGQVDSTLFPLEIGGRGNLIEGANGVYVVNTDDVTDEEAAYIVTACNSFPALVEALERLGSSNAFDMPFAMDKSQACRELRDRIDFARESLAKAESGQSVAVAPESDAVSGVVHDGFRGDHKAIHCSELIEYFENRLAALQASRDELLEVLRFLLGHCDPSDARHIIPKEVATAARAAIKKAEALKKE